MGFFFVFPVSLHSSIFFGFFFCCPQSLLDFFSVRSSSDSSIPSCLLFILVHGARCDNTPLVGPHYLKLLNHSWPSDCLVVSLISGVFHISLQAHKTQHTKPSGWKKREHGLGLAPSPRRRFH